MRIGYTPGVWDLLHVGHVRFLRLAKAQCDRLIVGVPDDLTVRLDKGCDPIIPLTDRVEMLGALRDVDAAVPYDVLDFLPHLRHFLPAVVFVGQDWGHDRRHTNAEEWCEENCVTIVRLPYTAHISTTAICERAWKRQELLKDEPPCTD